MPTKKLPLPVKLIAFLYLLQGVLNGGLGIAFLIELLTDIDLAPGADPEGFAFVVLITAFLSFCGLLTVVGWNLWKGKRPALLGAIVVSSLEMGFYMLLGFAGWLAAMVGLGNEALWVGLGGATLHVTILLYLIFSGSVRDAFGR
jgi:hypothetical protein